eukprot:6158743-Pyramimonas_sp.AAC.1
MSAASHARRQSRADAMARRAQANGRSQSAAAARRQQRFHQKRAKLWKPRGRRRSPRFRPEAAAGGQ